MAVIQRYWLRCSLVVTLSLSKWDYQTAASHVTLLDCRSKRSLVIIALHLFLHAPAGQNLGNKGCMMREQCPGGAQQNAAKNETTAHTVSFLVANTSPDMYIC